MENVNANTNTTPATVANNVQLDQPKARAQKTGFESHTKCVNAMKSAINGLKPEDAIALAKASGLGVAAYSEYERHANGIDKADYNKLIRAETAEKKREDLFGIAADLIVEGRLHPENAQAVKKGKAAEADYLHYMAIALKFGIDLKLQKLADKYKCTVEKAIQKASYNELKTAFANNGCKLFENKRRLVQNKLDRKLAALVKNGDITQEEADRRALSIKSDGKKLIMGKKEPKAAAKPKTAEDWKKEIQKICNQYIEMPEEIRSELFRQLLAMKDGVKLVNAELYQLSQYDAQESKIDSESPDLDEVTAAYRSARNFVNNADKGVKKPTKEQLDLAIAARDEAAKILSDNNINPANIH